jgi:hypothetical protein
MDLKNWKQETDLITDSLWIINERDKSFGHSNIYHDNFVPQNNIITKLKKTKKLQDFNRYFKVSAKKFLFILIQNRYKVKLQVMQFKKGFKDCQNWN